MSFSDIFSGLVKLRYVLVIGSSLTGLGFKFGPVAWHKIHGTPMPGLATAGGTNSATAKLNPHDLGALTLTNHYERSISLGHGKNCLVVPRVIDRSSVELTLSLETRTPAGKVHDLTVTQITTKTGKPLEVAVGDFNFSMTPMLVSQ